MLSIKNFTKNRINKKFLEKVERTVIKNIPELRKKPKIEIGLAIIGAKRMRWLNHVWRGKNRVTDVLSFESGEFGRQKKGFIHAPAKSFHLGDILISYPVAKKEAKEDGLSIEKEMAILLIHGILHLSGYNHEKSKKEEEKMFALQEKIIAKIFVGDSR